MLAGIPGTIGGAVAMNAGAHGGEIADHLVEVEIIHDGIVQRIQKDEKSLSFLNASLWNPETAMIKVLPVPSNGGWLAWFNRAYAFTIRSAIFAVRNLFVMTDVFFWPMISLSS